MVNPSRCINIATIRVVPLDRHLVWWCMLSAPLACRAIAKENPPAIFNRVLRHLQMAFVAGQVAVQFPGGSTIGSVRQDPRS